MNALDLAPLPDWMEPTQPHSNLPQQPHNPRYPRTVAEKEMRQSALDGVFWRSLEALSEGVTIRLFLRSQEAYCPRITPEEYFQYMRRDPVRKAAYREAEEIGVEMRVSEMIPIADNDPEYCPTIEDTNAKRLRLEARKWLAEKWYKQKYGDKTTVDINSTTKTTVTLQTIVDDRMDRVRRIIEGTTLPALQLPSNPTHPSNNDDQDMDDQDEY